MENLIGVRINIALTNRGMRQSQLSYKTGIDRSAISSYISGRYKPKQDALFAMAKALRVSPQWLAGFDVPMNGPETTPEEPKLSDKEKKLIDLLRSVADEDRDALYDKIEFAIKFMK